MSSIVNCLIEWEHNDGKRILCLEKRYKLPSWLHVGTHIESDIFGGNQKVESSCVNLERCEQRVYLTECHHQSPEEMEDFVAMLLRHGWTIEMEDSFV